VPCVCVFNVYSDFMKRYLVAESFRLSVKYSKEQGIAGDFQDSICGRAWCGSDVR
jgi:hypothetical protein